MRRGGAVGAFARAASLLGVVAVVGCADEVRSQLVVVVASDMRVPDELDAVDVRVLGPLEGRALDERYPLSGAGALSLPFSFGVAPAGDDASRRVTIELDARRGERVLFTVRRRPDFVAGEVRRLVIFLAARCSGLDPPCEPRTTCDLDGCVPELVDARTLEPYRPESPLPDAGARLDLGALDLGTDTSIPDAAMLDAARDGGPADAGEPDTGPPDAGIDAGPDAAELDARADDAGRETGPADAGPDVRDLGPDARDGGSDAGDAAGDAGDAGGADASDGGDGGDASTAGDAGDSSTASDAGDAGDAAGDAGDAGDAGMCAESPCRVLAPQCGCPGGLGCTLGSGDTVECRSVGTGTDGATCIDVLDCAAGFACIRLSGSSTSFCRQLCVTTAGCSAGFACLDLTSSTRYGSCQPFCDLNDPMACPGSLGCVFGELPVAEGGTLLGSACTTVGTGMIDSACVTARDCLPGMICVNPGTGPRCRPWCQVSPSEECAPGTGSCARTSPRAMVGTSEYGACI